MKQGINIVGRLAGVAVEPWAREDGKGGVNVTIGIARAYVDRFGAEETETFAVDVRGDALQVKLREQAERLRGELVSVNVRVQCFDSKRGPFVKYSAMAETEIVPLLTSAPTSATGTKPAA